MNPDRLGSIPLFASLSRHQRTRIAEWADELDVPEGKYLVDEGRFAYEFFVVEEGTAQVVKAGQPIAQLGPGDFFGEIGLMEADRRTASVVARSPMRVIVMFEREFRQMTDEMPQVADQIRQAVETRLHPS